MIFTITPNTAIDKTYVVESFQIDRVHRPLEQHTVAGGKGINVTRVYRTLGGESIAGGYVGGKIGKSFLKMLDEEGMPHRFIEVRDESRFCIAIMDKHANTQTEINENGPNISPEEVDALLELTETMAEKADAVVLCGSCPPGVGYDFYGRLIDVCKRKNCKTLLDASGKHLAEAVKHCPDVVKPNQLELSHILGRPVKEIDETAEGAIQVCRDYGIGMVVVTLGKDGCIATDGKSVWKAVPPPIKFASAVGSGDSFAAGLLFALHQKQPLSEAIKLATAAGTANAATYGAGYCSRCSIMKLYDGVSVKQII